MLRIIVIGYAIAASIVLVFVMLGQPQRINGYLINDWCDAIKHEEGATYGVGNFSDQRQVCINTVLHKYKDWSNLRMSLHQSFITYLSQRYCPYNSVSWAHNVQYWLNKGE